MIDYIYRQLPQYYPYMYFDGYSPQEILTAFRNAMYAQIEERTAIPEVVIKSEVKVK